MSLKTAIPFIGAAVAVGVLGAVTGGIAIGPTLLFAASLGFGAGLLLDTFLFKPKMVTSSAPQFQFASAQEGAPCPVVFGTYRIPGNFINFDPLRVGTKAITQKAGGKGSITGGSQEQVVGYIYSAPFEYGLCMGPVDSIGEVYTSPNAKKVRNLSNTIVGAGTITGTVGTQTITGSGTAFLSQVKQNGVLTMGTTSYTVAAVIDNHTVTTFEIVGITFGLTAYTITNVILNLTEFSGSDYLNLSLAGQESEQGTVRVYQGNATQTRIGASDPWGSGDSVLNYRNMCYAVFLSGFQLGQQPTAKTYQFEIGRMPKCVDATGTPIPGFETRGSLDTTHICYQDANPAAIAYEILTNKIWGMRRDPSRIDIDSFRQTAYSLAAGFVGMSFAIDSSQNLSDILDTIKQETGVAVYDNGTVVKCRWLYDTKGPAYVIKAKLTKSSLKNFKHVRPNWGGQTNEVRGQFTNRLAAYTVSMAHEQDLAAIRTVGFIRSSTVNLIGLSNPDLAQRMTARILREAAYPQATVSFTMNWWDSPLEQFDLFELDWDEWYGVPVKAYYRVVTAEFNDDEEGGINITAMEDTSYVPTTDENPTFEEPVFPFQQINPIGNSESSNASPPATAVPDISPVTAIELNCFASPLVPRAAFAMAKKASYLTNADISWSDLAANDFTSLGRLACFSVTGTLNGAYPITGDFDRRTGLQMNLIVPATDLATILGANQVQTDADSFEALISTQKYYLLIDQEIMQVGFATDLGSGLVQLTNIARGVFGTTIQAHASGAHAFYIDTLDFTNATAPLTGMDAEALAGSPAVEFAMLAYANGRAAEDAVQIFINPDETVKFLANRPFAPMVYTSPSVTSGTPGTTTFTVNFKLRPRAILTGAGVDPIGIARTGSPVDPATEFRVQEFNAAGVQIGTGYALLTSVAVVTDCDPSDATTGLVVITGFTCQSLTKSLKIYSAVNGWPCVTPLAMSLGV